MIQQQQKQLNLVRFFIIIQLSYELTSPFLESFTDLILAPSHRNVNNWTIFHFSVKHKDPYFPSSNLLELLHLTLFPRGEGGF